MSIISETQFCGGSDSSPCLLHPAVYCLFDDSGLDHDAKKLCLELVPDFSDFSQNGWRSFACMSPYRPERTKTLGERENREEKKEKRGESRGMREERKAKKEERRTNKKSAEKRESKREARRRDKREKREGRRGDR